jgi:hypothetical protein
VWARTIHEPPDVPPTFYDRIVLRTKLFKWARHMLVEPIITAGMGPREYCLPDRWNHSEQA